MKERLAFVLLVATLALPGCVTGDVSPSTSTMRAQPEITSTTDKQPQPPTTVTTVDHRETTTTVDEGEMTIEVEIAGGEVLGGPSVVAVELGSIVRLAVTVDVADHVHVHGYDLFADVGPGSPTEIVFSADVPGVFEVELEESHLLLVEIEVS